MKKELLIIACTGLAAFAEPLFLDSNGNPISSSSRTVCGTSDLVPITDQDEVIQKLAKPVGLLLGPGYRCSGTLVGTNLFLTARHCYSECSELSVTFDYHSRDQSFACREFVEKGNDNYNQDYMLIRLEGSPGVERGWFDLSDRDLAAKDALLMIHHPNGGPMKASIKNCLYESEGGGLLYHSCDTHPGSSGSAIIQPDYEMPERSRVVGVHTFGGCNSSGTSFNSGPAVRNLVTVSQRIRDLVK